jgi:hypothetical protein
MHIRFRLFLSDAQQGKTMKTLLATTAILALTVNVASAKECSNITKDEVMAAQQAWADGIVAIGKAEDHEKAALNHLNTLYAYDLGTVLFKPTKAAADQFRGSKAEALSYFVKGIVPEDKGFALAPYTKVRFENEGVTIDCDSALAMGNYYFTTTEGKDIKVEYSFGYVEDKDGKLKINLHHSSLPYAVVE